MPNKTWLIIRNNKIIRVVYDINQSIEKDCKIIEAPDDFIDNREGRRKWEKNHGKRK